MQHQQSITYTIIRRLFPRFDYHIERVGENHPYPEVDLKWASRQKSYGFEGLVFGRFWVVLEVTKTLRTKDERI